MGGWVSGWLGGWVGGRFYFLPFGCLVMSSLFPPFAQLCLFEQEAPREHRRARIVASPTKSPSQKQRNREPTQATRRISNKRRERKAKRIPPFPSRPWRKVLDYEAAGALGTSAAFGRLVVDEPQEPGGEDLGGAGVSFWSVCPFWGGF